jgi:tocopherol O-methyltransferase
MISCPTVRKTDIRLHYDLTTLFYRLLWGRHIHHGLWDADVDGTGAEHRLTAPQAAQRLTERLSALAGIRKNEFVLDVGCGMGGSSIHLAKTLDCRVTGVTLSPFQKFWARSAARWHGVQKSVDFKCQDAEKSEFANSAFDVIWSVECTEHLFDKAAFFKKGAQWLKPGGRMAICAWLAGDDPLDEDAIQQVYKVCEGFFCPSLASRQDYSHWFSDAGLASVHFEDWTQHVTRTWELCIDRVRQSRVRWLARVLHQDTVMFLDHFETILRAYQTGAMKYGCFVAK